MRFNWVFCLLCTTVFFKEKSELIQSVVNSKQHKTCLVLQLAAWWDNDIFSPRLGDAQKV